MGTTHGVTKARDVTHADEVSDAAAFATSGGSLKGADLSTRVEIHVSIANMRKKYSTKCLVYTKRSQDPSWSEVGRTETCLDSKDPIFVKSVIVDFCFEVQQRVRVEVYNITNPNAKTMQGQEFVGFAECYIAETVARKGEKFHKALEHPTRRDPGILSLRCEELTNTKSTVAFTLRCVKLPGMGFFSRRPDPYAIILRTPKILSDQDGENQNSRRGSSYEEGSEPEGIPVYRTEVVKRNGNPRFQQIDVSVQQLCRGEELRPIKIEVYHWTRTGTHQLMGECTTTYADLQRGFQDSRPLMLQLSNDGTGGSVGRSGAGKDRYKKRPAKPAGQVVLEDIVVNQKFSFLDYINGGLEMGLQVAIDFTQSNGDPREKDSLHYFDTKAPNDYVMAIRAGGEILQHYDSDKMYPVYGFGAKLPPSHSVVSHCFALKGDVFDPEVEGIEGIVDIYRTALQVVTLHGPTSFASVIRNAANLAEPYARIRKNEDELKYFILLIITDGVINDMQDTINEVVRASEFPMSIIIVGVGNEDFSMMDELDADDKPLYSTETKKFMARDIVQFVPFNEFKDRSYHELAMATLDEVPREVVNYFTKKFIAPRPSPEGVRQTSGGSGGRERASYELKPLRRGSALSVTKEDLPKYLQNEKHRLIQSAVSQGYTKDEVELTVEEGLPSTELDVLLDILTHGGKGKGNPFAQALEKVAQTDFSVLELAPKATDLKGKLIRSHTTDRGWGGEAASSSAEKTRPSLLPGQASDDADQARARDAKAKAEKEARKLQKRGTKQLTSSDAEDLGNLCKVCFEVPINTVILECGHQVVCDSCSENVGSLCPLCRQPIVKIIKTFTS